MYVPSQQYEEECAERRALGARVEELEGEAEASAGACCAVLCLAWRSPFHAPVTVH